MLAVAQLGDRAIVAVLVKSLLLTAAIFAAGGVALSFAADWLAGYYLNSPEAGLLAQAAAAILAVAAIWLLFRAVAIPVIGLFADEVVAAVEARHYPEMLASARPASLGLSLRMGLMSFLRLLGANLLALPVYLLLIPTAIGPVVLFVIVNALLLGRDVGEMVAARHLSGPALKAWLRNSRGPRAVLGLGMTMLFTVPLANFLAPVIGAAVATHLYHGRKE